MSNDNKKYLNFLLKEFDSVRKEIDEGVKESRILTRKTDIR